MEIEAAGLMMPTAASSGQSIIPSASEAELFARALFGNQPQTPEIQAATSLQAQGTKIESTFSAAASQPNILNDPTRMLVTQAATLRTIVEVELTSKVAGSVAGSINKLVSMQ
ncbi:MAG: type III secretion system inner rod subunit SctI [Ottowia sp.]|nr:type III secretion system inner rod subunit SctI [Ottowia sp.]